MTDTEADRVNNDATYINHRSSGGVTSENQPLLNFKYPFPTPQTLTHHEEFSNTHYRPPGARATAYS
jgi:hypothetical protein